MKYTNRNQDCIFRWAYNTNDAIRINDSQHTSHRIIKACTQRRPYLPEAASQSTELGLAVVFMHLAASCLWSTDSCICLTSRWECDICLEFLPCAPLGTSDLIKMHSVQQFATPSSHIRVKSMALLSFILKH